MTDRIKLGNATVTRVLEWEFDVGTGLFAETPPDAWQDNADLLVPTFYDPATGRWRVVMQSWVIDVDGLTVVVDTGVGNDRERPHIPALSGLSTDFLGALSRAGVDPAEVDVVVNTHLHTDHVGWNTKLVFGGGAPRPGDGPDGDWVPTFPNARYLVPEADFRFFAPDGPGASEGARITAPASRGRTHPWVVGVVARGGQASGLRRRSDALPHPDSKTRRPVRIRRGSGCGGGDPQAGVHRGGQVAGHGDSRALSRARRGDGGGARRPVRGRRLAGVREGLGPTRTPARSGSGRACAARAESACPATTASHYATATWSGAAR
jgi:hypothetical protein